LSIGVRFEGIRRGALPPVVTSEPGEIEPVWSETRGAPYVSAVRITIGSPERDPVCHEISITSLSRQVREVVRLLRRSGQLAEEDVVRSRICAFPADQSVQSARGQSGSLFAVEEVPRPLSLIETPIDRFASGAEVCDVRDDDTDVPVFLPRAVLEEAEALSRAAGEVETGGVLVGRLHREAAVPDLFLEITAQSPARHTIADCARLTFTPETWAAAETEIAARGMSEQMAGWWHYHPYFCGNCPPERRRDCLLDSGFFSADDVSLHHLCFAQAHQIALLVSARPSNVLDRSLFGWRHGMVTARGYYLTGGSAAVTRPMGESHEITTTANP
jgi:hypothetical protein